MKTLQQQRKLPTSSYCNSLPPHHYHHLVGEETIDVFVIGHVAQFLCMMREMLSTTTLLKSSITLYVNIYHTGLEEENDGYSVDGFTGKHH